MKDEVLKVVDILKREGTVLYPTDTIWGMGCDGMSDRASRRILEIKRRSSEKSFIVLVSDVEMLKRYVDNVPTVAIDLIKAAIKPLTIIYPNAHGLSSVVMGADSSIAVRVVRHEFCSDVIRLLDRPIVSTSANVSGDRSPATFSEISPSIIKEVDYAVEQDRDVVRSSVPSTLIKLISDGDFEVIRD